MNAYEKKDWEQRRAIAKLTAQVTALTRANNMKDLAIEKYKAKYQFKSLKGRPTMIVKLGSRELKWIPGPAHFAAVTKQIKGSKLDEKYNVLLVNAFASFEVQN